MNPDAPSTHAIAYENLLVRLSRLMASGEGDGADADSIREDMEVPGERLSAKELQFAKGLSADLYMLENAELPDPKALALPEAEINSKLAVAFEHKQWEQVLFLLRGGKASPPAAGIAYLRFRAYSELGYWHAALAFIEHAIHCEPANERFLALRLQCLLRLGDHAVGEELAHRLMNDPNSNIRTQIFAASALAEIAAAVPVGNNRNLVRAELVRTFQQILVREGLTEKQQFVARTHLALLHMAEGRFEDGKRQVEHIQKVPAADDDTVQVQISLQPLLVEEIASQGDLWQQVAEQLVQPLQRLMAA